MDFSRYSRQHSGGVCPDLDVAALFELIDAWERELKADAGLRARVLDGLRAELSALVANLEDNSDIQVARMGQLRDRIADLESWGAP
jgi:hypothetical protein